MIPRGHKVLKPIHPNAGIGADYRGRLDRLVGRMQRSYAYFLKAQYRASPPRMAMDSVRSYEREVDLPPFEIAWGEGEDRYIESIPRTRTETVYIAMDETPAKELERELRRLGIQWEKEFAALAPKMARWFSTSIERRSTLGMKKMLKDAGMTVNYTMTPAMRDVFQATVQENVSLIKSIASQYHTDVTGLVMRSVQSGRDLAPLVRELEARYGVTRRRAALIARDQNNKATAVMSRVRQTEAGIKQAVWLHSLGGKEPRKTHIANNGKVYDIAKGWFDPDPRVRRFIWPGELINCRCVPKPIVKGFS